MSIYESTQKENPKFIDIGTEDSILESKKKVQKIFIQ